MTMPLFTFIAEHNGGTYIQQLHARSAKAALAKYAREANWINTEKLGEALKGEQLVQLEGVIGVYCVTGILKRRLLLLNLIRTEN